MRTYILLACAIVFAESTNIVPEYLDEETVSTQIGANHTFRIQDFTFVTSDTCMITSPNGTTYDLLKDEVAGIEKHSAIDASCGVKITVNSEDFVGNWSLQSNGSRLLDPIERILNFVVVVEEAVEASPSVLIVAKGNNFHIGLAKATTVPETCKLYRPQGIEYKENTTEISNYCSYNINNVTTDDNGTWVIVYGDTITYKAAVQVTVVGNFNKNSTQEFVWTLGAPVNQVIGPEDAIYCKIIDSYSVTVFEDFGRCNISIDRVTSKHAGYWKMSVGMHGSVLPEETIFTVVVKQADPKSTVIPYVVVREPIVTLTCFIESKFAVKACKFRDPSGKVLLAHEGISQSRYRFHGATVMRTYDTVAQNHTCALQITDPVVSDIGLWRCGVQTEDDTYFGHLSVRCPWVIKDVEVAAAIITEPTLSADRFSVYAFEDESITLSCSIQAAIRYCYFRASNGTIFHVSPGQSNYVGAGFDAGECGVRFPGLSANDSGTWSCHVGLTDASQEQRRPISISIQEPLRVKQYLRRHNLIIEADALPSGWIDYCVFVRIDGLGFTTDNAPMGYRTSIESAAGSCMLRISSPTTLDRHPWTVMVKVSGKENLVTKVTDMALRVPDTSVSGFRFPTLWVIVMVVGLSMLLVAIVLGPQKNRKWAAERSASVRNSFRNSLRKPPLNNTSTAA
ncbi:uncharacterized protein LOC123709652 [Pieris brassicae]|uniref:uncharacterized protein LOC123709652 n=1 Tax=Pieris brassicae TaxID=7116 RepID=UPI001E65E342|nr:uncharacterized protein LOC123709652 [Pieris brassicae]